MQSNPYKFLNQRHLYRIRIASVVFDKIFFSSETVNDLNASTIDTMPLANEDAAESDLRKAVAFVYLGLVWIFAIVILGWVLHRRATKSDRQG